MLGKILICGDSFAAEWPVTDNNIVNNIGWPLLLKNQYSVVNQAKPGVGEYKILQQLINENLSDYAAVIVCHTSPNRVHIKKHPIHKDFYKDADLIYNDVVEHASHHSSNLILQTAKNYFELVYDQDYYNDIYRLIQKEIISLTADSCCLHLTPLFDSNNRLFTHCLNLEKMCSLAAGDTNHYNSDNNKKIFCAIKKWIDEHA
jgi:hypothetical protein